MKLLALAATIGFALSFRQVDGGVDEAIDPGLDLFHGGALGRQGSEGGDIQVGQRQGEILVVNSPGRGGRDRSGCATADRRRRPRMLACGDGRGRLQPGGEHPLAPVDDLAAADRRQAGVQDQEAVARHLQQLLPILVMALQDFDEATGDAIAQLDAQTLRATFERVFSDLSRLARARAALPNSWLQGGGVQDGSAAD